MVIIGQAIRQHDKIWYLMISPATHAAHGWSSTAPLSVHAACTTTSGWYLLPLLCTQRVTPPPCTTDSSHITKRPCNISSNCRMHLSTETPHAACPVCRQALQYCAKQCRVSGMHVQRAPTCLLGCMKLTEQHSLYPN